MGFEITDKDFGRFSDLVYNRSGIRLHEGKRELLRSRLGKRLRATNSANFEEYLRFLTLEDDGSEMVRMLDAVTTNKTSFFREREHFDFLERELFPSCMDHERNKARVRLWSAGCSSGQEPYSMAISILEYFRASTTLDAKILATDISTDILEKARVGVYPEAQVQTLPVTWQRRYFQKGYGKQEGFYKIKDILKKLIVFSHHNLTRPFTMDHRFNAIFCRNTMIYFEKKSKNFLVNRLYDSLFEGGYLLIGHSESLAGMDHQFTYVAPSIYRK